MRKATRKSKTLNVQSVVDNESTTEQLSLDELCAEGTFESAVYSHLHLHNRHLLTESDRAAGVLAPAFLDDLLGQLLRVKLNESTSTASLLAPDRGALGTFSAKIDMTHSMGLIDSTTWNDLHIIRKIRNRFAHEIDIHDFSDDSVRDLVANLSIAGKVPESVAKDPRKIFTYAVGQITFAIAKNFPNGT